MIGNKPQGVVVGEDENRRFSRSALADVFEKNEKKNKTASVYRLIRKECIHYFRPTLFQKAFILLFQR